MLVSSENIIVNSLSCFCELGGVTSAASVIVIMEDVDLLDDPLVKKRLHLF